MKKGLFSLCFLLVVFVGYAQGIKYHKVVKGETLYSISKKYSLKIGDVVKVNPGLTSKSHVKLGQKLRIPVRTATASAPKPVVPAKIRPVPSTPDTPYSEEDNTARVKSIREDIANASTTISNEPVVTEPAKVESPPVSLRTTSANPAEYPVIFSQYYTSGYRTVKVRGAANYLGDNTSGNQYLAFYNGAETGSVIKVTNMMNKKTIYLKVVGKVPYADASQEVILKISNKAARELGAIDEKFLVEVVGCVAN